MIRLTRLNGQILEVNCDLIKLAESSPDTVLTLITGEKIVVREPLDEIARLALEYRAATLRHAWPCENGPLSAGTHTVVSQRCTRDRSYSED